MSTSSAPIHTPYTLPNVRTLLYISFSILILILSVIAATMSTLATRSQAPPSPHHHPVSRPISSLPLHQSSFRNQQSATTSSYNTLFSPIKSFPHTMSQSPAPAQSENTSLRQLCLDIRKQIDNLLNEDTEDVILARVQTRTRASLAVIQEALHRYS